MSLEVVSQLSGGGEEHEEELLLHGVPLASVAQHSADEVYWMLDEGRLGVAALAPSGGSSGPLWRPACGGVSIGELWQARQEATGLAAGLKRLFPHREAGVLEL